MMTQLRRPRNVSPKTKVQRCKNVQRAVEVLTAKFGDCPPDLRNVSCQSFRTRLVEDSARLRAWGCKEGANDPRIRQVLKALDGR